MIRQLSRDVFVAPENVMFLAVFFGTGIHIFLIFCFVQAIICLGILEVIERGQLLTLAIVLYAFFGAFSGYSAARYRF